MANLSDRQQEKLGLNYGPYPANQQDQKWRTWLHEIWMNTTSQEQNVLSDFFLFSPPLILAGHKIKRKFESINLAAKLLFWRQVMSPLGNGCNFWRLIKSTTLSWRRWQPRNEINGRSVEPWGPEVCWHFKLFPPIPKAKVLACFRRCQEIPSGD